jgi:hypothetical protein
MGEENSYVACPGGCGAILTEEYKARYGQCKACYAREHVPLGVRIHQAL